MEYRFKLDPSSRKFFCPSCEKKTLVRFVDSEKRYLENSDFGRCDREINCGYFLYPNLECSPSPKRIIQPDRVKGQKYYVPDYVLRRTTSHFTKTQFYKILTARNISEKARQTLDKVLEEYAIGGIIKGRWEGAVSFPFIDANEKIHAIQVKSFGEDLHTVGTTFIHTLLLNYQKSLRVEPEDWISNYYNQEKKIECYFGEHLLKKYSLNPVALVEAPKTAIVATFYFGLPTSLDSFIWLSTYNLTGLNVDKSRVLEGRKVVLFPDSSISEIAFYKWSNIASMIKKEICLESINVSTFLKEKATHLEKESGADLADYLLQYDWEEFHRSVKSVDSEELKQKS